MSSTLRELRVLVLDAQASGATPHHGELLELGWALTDATQLLGPVHSHWLQPRTSFRVSRPVRELTGWSERCLREALPAEDVWRALQGELSLLAASAPVPTFIHFARFELPFLQELHTRSDGTAFPLDVRCLHAIAARLYPDLPRRNIRALAGFLGHSTELIRRAAGHVEASAFIWRALVPGLEAERVHTLDELDHWLSAPAPKRARGKRQFPFAAERRRALPSGPGVYRFVRSNGDVLYVGKATSIKKRIAGHFRSSSQHTERTLELLTQVHDIVITETPSTLEAALLESDEIKRIDPPYNVHLRSYERQAWFAARDLHDARTAPDADHAIGPVPSRRALSALYAMAQLLAGHSPSPLLRALSLAVPSAFVPEQSLFDQGWQMWQADLVAPAEARPQRRLERAAMALWLERGRSEPEAPEASEDAPPDRWDLARVRRRLDRNLIQAGLLMRRARWLCLLADADIAFRERDSRGARVLRLASARVVEAADLPEVAALQALPSRPLQAHHVRQAAFDAAGYDRMRVIATELARIQNESADLTIRLGKHVLRGELLRTLMRAM